MAERQITELIENDQVGMRKAIGNPPLFTVLLLLLQRIDQLYRGQEPHAQPVMLNGLNGDGGGQVVV